MKTKNVNRQKKNKYRQNGARKHSMGVGGRSIFTVQWAQYKRVQEGK